MVDDEFGDIAHKDRSFADKVLFWRKGQPSNQGAADVVQASTEAAPVDPDAAAANLKPLTGGQQVVIQRDKRGSFIKLPGL